MFASNSREFLLVFGVGNERDMDGLTEDHGSNLENAAFLAGPGYVWVLMIWVLKVLGFRVRTDRWRGEKKMK